MLRILLMPIYLAVRAMSIMLNLIIRISDWIFYLLGGLFLLTALLCYYMQIEDGSGLRHMVTGGGIMLLIPQAASLISVLLGAAGEIIGNKVRIEK